MHARLIPVRAKGRDMARARRLIAIAVAIVLPSCGERAPEGTPPELPREAAFVGSASCATCHPGELDAWRGSHHDLAMQHATPETVLGDFDGATFLHAGTETAFSEADGRFFVRTDGADGVVRDYEVRYTFGVDPLQQYLVEFPDGRIQALPFCWDSRPESAGGQRWFHLYPDERVDHRDPLHWTGPQQNWNFMCAECHSTALEKNYDPDADRFDTRWSEIDVSCEACHGPGSAHVAWAESLGAGAAEPGGTLGLVTDLAVDDGGSWTMNAATGIAARSRPRANDTELQTCARCHARRATIHEGVAPGGPLLDTHRPALLDEGLYFADGQILEEVYVYGSFLQSRMHAAGVTCSDCHEPHSLTLRAPGNSLCATCHAPSRFDTAEHHRHRPGTPGASCVECHMPSRTYMSVDPRRDHSFRVPRPDLAAALGTPNACAACHADRSDDWLAARIRDWREDGSGREDAHYGVALHAGRSGSLDAPRLLEMLASDAAAPGIARATAVSLLPGNGSAGTARAIERAAGDADPLVRLAAAGAAEGLDPASRADAVAPLLDDPLRAVRIEAALALAALPREAIPAERRPSFETALEEYRASQRLHADRAESRFNLGLLEQRLGRSRLAETEYRAAIAISPAFGAAYVNLADLLSDRGNEAGAEAVLRDGLAAAPRDASVHHALGLSLVRQKRYDEAVASLREAARLAPGVSRHAYVLAIALHSLGGPDEALQILEEAHRRRTGDVPILEALVSISTEAGHPERARRHARTLLERSPGHPLALRLAGEAAR